MFGFVVLYHVSFFIFITTIGLNIIFGIIVDTFSELRDLKVIENTYFDTESVSLPLFVSKIIIRENNSTDLNDIDIYF